MTFPSVFAESKIPRKIHVYCLALPRCGTTSMTELFLPHYRSGHESLNNDVAARFWSGRPYTREGMADYYRRRDQVLNLDVESSHLLLNASDVLPEVFPDAKFIFMIRDCYAWVESWINHARELFAMRHAHVHVWARHVFADGEQFHPPEEKVLADCELPTLDAHFRYWAKWNTKALENIPSERLLILRTNEISQKVQEIADFCGVDIRTLSVEKSWSHQRLNKEISLRALGPAHVEEVARRHCAPLMERFFPGRINFAV